MQKRGLGKGLEALIPVREIEDKERILEITKEDIIHKIDISKIKPNRYQSRKKFDNQKLKELADSIKENGILQPLIVAKSIIPNEFELIAGERRFRAAKMVNLKEVPAVIRKVNEKEKFQISLIENLQREDLNPIEEANAYDSIMNEFELTQEQLSKIVSKDRSVIANTLRLLSLPSKTQDLVSEGYLSSGHARTLVSISDRVKQEQLLNRILKEKLTVREIEKIVSDWKITVGKIKKKKRSVEVISLENELQKILGTKVQIKHRGKKGKLIIFFYSLNELDRILKLLKSYKH